MRGRVRRQNPKKNSGKKGGSGSERQHAKINGSRRKTEQLLRNGVKQSACSPNREKNPQRSPPKSEQTTFVKQLANNSPATRAQSRANSHFFFAAGGAGKKQTRHVCAGDEQNKSDRAEQNQKRGTHGARNFLAYRNHVHAPTAVVFGIFRSQTCGNHAHLRLCLRQRDGDLEARNNG